MEPTDQPQPAPAPYKLHDRMEHVMSQATIEALAAPPHIREGVTQAMKASRELIEFVDGKGWDWNLFTSAANNVYLQFAFKETSQLKVQHQMNVLIQAGQMLGVALNHEQQRLPWLLADQSQASKILLAR